MSTFILAALRTPVGAFGGAFRSFSAVDLAAPLLPALLEGGWKGPLRGLLAGQALQAGCGPNPAAALARKAGLPAGTPALTLNQGAASGLGALQLAMDRLQANPGGWILAGGMESSSGAPFLLPSARWGTRMGEAPVLDALIQDGQPWPGAQPGPEEAALAQRSRRMAESAREEGWLGGECLPLTFRGRKGEEVLSVDEALASPAGPPSGVLRPGDAAAFLLLAGEGTLGDRPPLARIRRQVVDRDGPSAILRLLQEEGLRPGDVDRFELDESRPARLRETLSRLPGADPARVNLRGGALSLGHPLGAEGAIRLVSLARQIRDHGLRFGVAAQEGADCASALLLERP